MWSKVVIYPVVFIKSYLSVDVYQVVLIKSYPPSRIYPVPVVFIELYLSSLIHPAEFYQVL